MRGDLDWNDDDIETRVFFQPEDELEPAQRVPVPRPAPMQLAEASSPMRFAHGTAPTPTMRAQHEVVDDRRYSIPSLANILEPQASLKTIAVRRQRQITPLQLGLASACALIGITIGGLIAFTGHANVAVHAASLPAPVHPVTVAPLVVLAPQPAPAPVVVAAPVAPALVTLHVESSPAGASVMLVGDAGATTLVGTTPVATQVEAARDYDVLVKLPNHAPRIEHVAAASAHQLVIDFDAPAVAAAPVHHHHEAAVAVAKGNLRIAAKPPCSIAIDGRPTGMVTPQASIALPTGHHTVTLTNAEQGISLTKDVVIQADQATSLIQNFLD